MKSATIFNTLMFVLVGLQQYSDCAPDILTETSCVEPGYPQSMSLRCDQDHVIATRSAFYARLPFNAPAFCQQPTVDGNRGDCVPHAHVDRDQVAHTCNLYQSCELSTWFNRPDVVSACSNVTGQVYFTVVFECLRRTTYDGSYIDSVYISDATNVIVNNKVYIFSSSYPNQRAISSNKCQMRVPANADTQVRLMDLRETSSSGTGCVYQLYVYSGVSNVYRQWCATSDPTSSYQQPFLLHSTDHRPVIVDIVVDQKVSSAAGAFWFEFEARLKSGAPAENISIICGSSVQLQPLPFSSSPTTSTSTTTSTTTTTTNTPWPTTRSTTTTTTPTTTTTTITPWPTIKSTTTTTTPTTTTTTTTPRPTTTSTTTTTKTTTTITPSTRSTSRTSSTTTTSPTATKPSVRPSISSSMSLRSSTAASMTTTVSVNVSTSSSSISGPNLLMIGCGAAGGVLLLVIIIIIVIVLIARNRRQAKLRRLSKMLPDVIGTWKYDGNRGDPGGSGPNDGFDTSLHELEPVSSSPYRSPEPIYLEPNVADSVLEETVITPTAAPPLVQAVPPSSYEGPDPVSLEPDVAESVPEETAIPITPTTASPQAQPVVPKRTTILFDPSTMERQNNRGQVRFVAPEDGTIQYPGRGTSFPDDDRHDWRITPALMHARDRHPNSFGDRAARSGGSSSSSPPPAARRKAAKPPPPSLTSPRVTARQASDTEMQQNPLYGASIDLFIY